MKSRLSIWLFAALIMTLLFTACKARPATVAINSSDNDIAVSTVVATEPISYPPATETEIAEPTVQPSLVESSTATEETDEVRQAARDYFIAVSEGKSETATNLLSSFSLMVFQMTRGDATEALQEQKISGIEWSNLEILDVQQFDEQTMLVHVTYTQKVASASTETPQPTASATQSPSTGETIDELWPMRLESGEWRYNWKNVIDFETMDAESQTMNGVTILPLQLTRFSDGIELSLLVQNRTNETVVLGQANETLGTFYFDGQTVIAEKTQWVLNPLRSFPEAVLEIKGLYTSFPDKVEIRKWNSYQVNPWFTFILE